MPLCTPLQALERVAAHIAPLPAQALPLMCCASRCLAAPLEALVPAPRQTQSAMDGWALRHADLPGPLSVMEGQSRPGVAAPDALPAGSALRIFTGGALPAGADAVLRQEDASWTDGQLTSRGALTPWRDVRRRGEDFELGQALLPAGERLGPAQLALAHAAGHQTLWVRPAPRVALLISGDELGSAPELDTNGPMLCAALARRGVLASPRYVPDTLEGVIAAMREAASDAALIVTTGGLSVGEHDHIRAAAQALGVTWQVERVAQRPGRPLSFGLIGHTPLLALPGPPPAALIGAWTMLEAALDALEGITPRAASAAPLAAPVSAHPTDWRWAPCVWREGALEAAPSARLWELARAAVLACLPPSDAPLREGTLVRWWPC